MIPKEIKVKVYYIKEDNGNIKIDIPSMQFDFDCVITKLVERFEEVNE